MVGKLQPLANNQAIVGPDGKPTEYFIRWAQQRQIDIGSAISAAQAVQIIEQFLEDHPLVAGSGISLTPNGNIADGVTISAQAQAILDQISTVQGSVLFRGATDWEALPPGTLGHYLQTQGAGADPLWAAGGGGGGGAPWSVAATWTHTTNVPNVDFGSLSGDEILIVVRDLASTASSVRRVRVSTDGGATFFSTLGNYLSLPAAGNAGNNSIIAGTTTSATTGRTFFAHILNAGVTGADKICISSAGNFYNMFVANGDPINGLRIDCNTGDISGGSITVLTR